MCATPVCSEFRHPVLVDQNDADALRRSILAEIARVEAQVLTLRHSFDAIVEAAELTSTDDEHDPEGATIAYERQQVAALIRLAGEDLAALQYALMRVDDGTAGLCAACGHTIATARLHALPGVRTCISCAA